MELKHLKRLGIFIFLALILFMVSIFSIGDRKGWFTDTFKVNVYFNDISGLESGAIIQISGLRAGKVAEIISPRKIGERVKLVLEIEDTYRELIREDALAKIETEGLVGNKIMIIQAGTESAKIVGPEDFILSKEPVRFDTIIDRFYKVTENVESIVSGIDQITDSLRRGKGSLGKLISSPALYNNLTSAAKSVDTAFTTFTTESKKISTILSDLSNSANKIIQKVENGQGTVGKLVGNDSLYNDLKSSSAKFIEVVTQLEDGVFSFSENMEALKHNWFFKGYYEDRGYWTRKEFESIDKIMEKRKLELDKLSKDIQLQLEILQEREKKIREAEEKLKTQTK